MDTTTDSATPRATTAEHPDPPRRGELISLVLSVLALIVSAVTLYFQFLYVADELKASKVNYDFVNNRISLELAIINSGTRQALVSEIYPVIYRDNMRQALGGGGYIVSMGASLDSVVPVEGLPITLAPGQIYFVTLTGSFNPAKYYSWGDTVSAQSARTGDVRKVQIGVRFSAMNSSGKTFETVYPFVDVYIKRNGEHYLYYDPGIPWNLFRQTL